MATFSAEIDSDVTITDSSSSDVPPDEVPPPVIGVQEEEVAMKHSKNEVVVPQWLKDLAGTQSQDWKAFVSKRANGHIDRTYIRKEYRHQFRSKCEVELFVVSNGITTGIFKGRKLQKKKIAGMDAQYAGTSKSAGRGASANHAVPKCSQGQSGSIENDDDDEDGPPGFL